MLYQADLAGSILCDYFPMSEDLGDPVPIFNTNL